MSAPAVQTSPDDDGEAPKAERAAVRNEGWVGHVGSAAGYAGHSKVYGGSSVAEQRKLQFSGRGEVAFE